MGFGWKCFGKVFLTQGCGATIVTSLDQRSEDLKKGPLKGLYISNHLSMADIPLVATIYQIPPVMKKEVLYLPVVGLIAWASGAMPVSRSKISSRKKVLKETMRRLKNNVAVQIYPEGTRSKTGEPKTTAEIKQSLLYYAYENNIPVIPTSLYGTQHLLSSVKVNPRTKLGIIVHAEIYPKDFPEANDFINACWGKVLEGVQLMKVDPSF